MNAVVRSDLFIPASDWKLTPERRDCKHGPQQVQPAQGVEAQIAHGIFLSRVALSTVCNARHTNAVISHDQDNSPHST